MDAPLSRNLGLSLSLLVGLALALPPASPAADPDIRPDQPEALAPRAKPRGFQWMANKNHVTPKSAKRSHVFYVGEPIRFELAALAARYEVRDYWGERVDSGACVSKGKNAPSEIEIPVKAPGWYKLYVYGKGYKPPDAKPDPLDELLGEKPVKSAEDEKEEKVRALWGDIVGATTFVIFRNDANFPPLPDIKAYNGANGTGDQLLRGVTGMGPQRHQADVTTDEKVDESIAKLEKDIALDRQYYLPFDPVRKRSLMIAFGNGTKNLDGVRKIVERFQNDVEYWEPRNEPNYGASPADFVSKELKPFTATVKGVNPKLKVIGPGTVSYNHNLLPWIDGFFAAGGGNFIDGFSMHAYNCVNGDLSLARRTLIELNDVLKKHGAENLEKWQTEQGFFACVYGAYQPRLQGRWTMLEMMVYEQFGIPKEHNHLWYDRSHGFWDFPTWWENDDGGLNPAAPLMRVFSEELFGTKFQKAFDFGPAGVNLYVGSLFVGEGKQEGKQVAAFQSSGSTEGRVTLKVKGGDSLKIVSAFGVESTLPVAQGQATLTVPELPVYVHLAAGQSIEVVPCDWGPNLARVEGAKAFASGLPHHPTNKAEDPADKRINNDLSKLINGEHENWYRTLQKDSGPWMSNVAEFPATVEVRLPQPAPVSRVVIYTSPPWQNQSTLVDYELQVDREGQWVTIERVKEPTKTFKIFSPATRTTVDSFFSERWCFQHQFEPVVTGKIRLLVHEVSHGGGATADVGEAGGQTGMRQIVLREFEIYGK